MVIHNLDIDWARFRPSETNSILVIDMDAVLSFALSCKRFQSITGWNAQFVKR
jgi:hypothetical protein